MHAQNLEEIDAPLSLRPETLEEARILFDEFKNFDTADIPVEVKVLFDKLGRKTYFLTVHEASLFLRIAEKTTLRLIEKGDLRSYRFGNKHRIPLVGLVDLLNRRDTFYE